MQETRQNCHTLLLDACNSSLTCIRHAHTPQPSKPHKHNSLLKMSLWSKAVMGYYWRNIYNNYEINYCIYSQSYWMHSPTFWYSILPLILWPQKILPLMLRKLKSLSIITRDTTKTLIVKHGNKTQGMCSIIQA